VQRDRSTVLMSKPWEMALGILCVLIAGLVAIVGGQRGMSAVFSLDFLLAVAKLAFAAALIVSVCAVETVEIDRAARMLVICKCRVFDLWRRAYETRRDIPLAAVSGFDVATLGERYALRVTFAAPETPPLVATTARFALKEVQSAIARLSGETAQ
jgi:hypothetical protein